MPKASVHHLARTLARYIATTAITGKTDLGQHQAVAEAFVTALEARVEQRLVKRYRTMREAEFNLDEPRRRLVATDVEPKRPKKIKKFKLPDELHALIAKKDWLQKRKQDDRTDS